MSIKFSPAADDVVKFLSSCQHECRRDAVAIGDIEEFGKKKLKLSGDELGHFVEFIAGNLLESGCSIVIQDPDSMSEFDWKLAPGFMKQNVADSLRSLLDFRQAAKDPHGYYAWFAFPKDDSGRPRISSS